MAEEERSKVLVPAGSGRREGRAEREKEGLKMG